MEVAEGETGAAQVGVYVPAVFWQFSHQHQSEGGDLLQGAEGILQAAKTTSVSRRSCFHHKTEREEKVLKNRDQVQVCLHSL